MPFLSIFLVCLLSLSGCPANADEPAGANDQASVDLFQAIRRRIKENPGDPQAHFILAELLRKASRNEEAAYQYLQATELAPDFYLAYHQLFTLGADKATLDEGIARLNELKADRPKDLLLRVALSELLEKRGNYYQGARTLVDLVYQNAIPDRYLPKVNARIHYLLAKAKDSYDSQKPAARAEDELDILPAPAPAPVEAKTGAKSLSSLRGNKGHVMPGVGNAVLLP